MRKLVVAVSVLIIYGSLYPFHFDLASFDPSMLPTLFDFRMGRIGRGDLLANIVLFLPFGFFAMQAAEHRTRWTSWLTILIAGFILAHTIQIAQLVIPGRVPSTGDTILNMLGCALGCLLGTLRMPRLATATNISTGPLPVPTIFALSLPHRATTMGHPG
jgi:VanZ family protein